MDRITFQIVVYRPSLVATSCRVAGGSDVVAVGRIASAQMRPAVESVSSAQIGRASALLMRPVNVCVADGSPFRQWAVLIHQIGRGFEDVSSAHSRHVRHWPEVGLEGLDRRLECQDQFRYVALHVLALLGRRFDEARQNVRQHPRGDGDTQAAEYLEGSAGVVPGRRRQGEVEGNLSPSLLQVAVRKRFAKDAANVLDEHVQLLGTPDAPHFGRDVLVAPQRLARPATTQ